MSVSVHLDASTSENTHLESYEVPSMGWFTTLRWGLDVSVYIPGYNRDVVRHMRDLAGKLLEEAKRLEEVLNAEDEAQEPVPTAESIVSNVAPTESVPQDDIPF